MNRTLLHRARQLCASAPDALLGQIVEILRVSPQRTSSAACLELCHSVTQHMTADNKAQFQALVQNSPDISLQELAGILTGLTYARQCAEEEHKASLVFTGPGQNNPNRRTEQVIFDIIKNAKRHILLVTFAAYKMASLTKALNEAISVGINVRLVLESRQESAQQLLHDAKNAFQGLQGANVYSWPLEIRPYNSLNKPAKLHAKCACSEDCVFVSSANFTEDAFTRNIEIGLFNKNMMLAKSVWEYFESLIYKKILIKIE